MKGTFLVFKSFYGIYFRFLSSSFTRYADFQFYPSYEIAVDRGNERHAAARPGSEDHEDDARKGAKNNQAGIIKEMIKDTMEVSSRMCVCAFGSILKLHA